MHVLCVCMYLCMYVCVYVCICMCMCMCICIHVCANVYVYVCEWAYAETVDDPLMCVRTEALMAEPCEVLNRRQPCVAVQSVKLYNGS